MDLDPGLDQARQMLQVETISGKSLITSGLTPAAESNVPMRLAGAWYHLMCNLRNVLLITPARTERRSCNEVPRSNLLHSGDSAMGTDASASSTFGGRSGSPQPASASRSSSASKPAAGIKPGSRPA